MDLVPEESRWKRRARRFAFYGVALELIGIAAFILTLLVGERSRLALVMLYLPRHPLLVMAILATLLVPFGRRYVRLLLPIQVLVCLIVLFPVMGFTLSTSARADRPIRLVTYNVYFGKAGRAELLEEIAAMPVDIVLVQAANSSMIERVRQRFPEWKTHQETEFLMMSKLPVRSIETPPPLADGTSSMFMKYVFDTPGGALRVYSVHPFSPRHAIFEDEQTPENIAHREDQIAAAVAAARSDVPPFIVAGDTNLPAMSSIGRRHLGGLVDAWSSVGLGFGYTFPAKRPWMRIDRVLAGDGVRFLNARVGPRGHSDHRPLFVNFELTSDR